MNTKEIEEKFNTFYEKLEQEQYHKMIELQNQVKKEDKIRHLMWILYAILVPLSFYIATKINKSIILISIFCLIIILVLVPILLMNTFTKKFSYFIKTYQSVLYNYIINSINNDWEFYYPTKPNKIKNNKSLADYYEAYFPKTVGSPNINGAIKNKVQKNIIYSMFFNIATYDVDTTTPDIQYKGLYMSISNNNNKILENIYIRN